MPKNYTNCSECPFNYTQKEKSKISANAMKTLELPLEKEDNGSEVLLVFEAPGFFEWRNRKPVFDSRDDGMNNSAGAMFAKALENNNKLRDSYDITEAVQCFPGSQAKKKQTEIDLASLYCITNLYNDLINPNYKKIVCFGEVASRSIRVITQIYPFSGKVIELLHPSAKENNQEKLDHDVRNNL